MLVYKEFILKGFHWQHVTGYHVKMDKLLQKETKVTKVPDDTYEGNQRPKIRSLAVSVLEKWEGTFLICRFNFTEQRMYSIPRMADTPIDFGDILDAEYNNFLYPGKIILHHIKIPLLSRPSYFWSIFCIPTLPFINLMYQILTYLVKKYTSKQVSLVRFRSTEKYYLYKSQPMRVRTIFQLLLLIKQASN